MKYHSSCLRENTVMIMPETVSECGLFQWLALRYKGKSVTIEFDTTTVGLEDRHPMMWIKEQDQ